MRNCVKHMQYEKDNEYIKLLFKINPELAHDLAVGSEWEPFITSDGFRACPNWGIDSMQKYGKAMLKGASDVSMDIGMRGSGKRK